MNRRVFLKQGLLAGSLMMGAGLSSAGCTTNLRRRMMATTLAEDTAGATAIPGLSRDERQILFYASLAPSGHNSQPWSVRVAGPGDWVVGTDPGRRLPVVDPDNREVLLSIGAFTENLVQAAQVLGYGVELEILAATPFDLEILRLRLMSSAKSGSHGRMRQMAARRTIKTGLGSERIRSSDLKALEAAAGYGLYYFPREGSHAKAMAETAVENFRIQFDSQAAMDEAARWTRLSDREAEEHGDGLTPDGMEIHGLAGFWARHFMDKTDVTGRLWREKAVEKVRAQVQEGAGWLVLTSPSRDVAALVDAGRRFQRLGLAAVDMGLGIHPMTQTLEEPSGQRAIRTNHASSMIPQFMLRVGYVAPYPEPVSLRRPVDGFVTG